MTRPGPPARCQTPASQTPASQTPGFRARGWSRQHRSPPRPLRPLRPLRLFERPEAIKVPFATVPDGPPARFHWRRARFDVVRAEGPERIAMQWWRDLGPTRDYFRVETQDGQRFWLYRDGLYDTASTAPRWFLHGIFA